MANDRSRPVQLATFMDGAAEQLFAEAFQKVLDNIADPNTDVKAVRKVTLEFLVKPNEKRTDAVVAVGCKTKLSTSRPVGRTVLLGMTEGRNAAVEVHAQEDLFGERHGKPAAVPATGTEG